jgi:hypothetical protein
MLATASGLLPVEKRRHPLSTDPMFSDNDIALNHHTIGALNDFKINRGQGYVTMRAVCSIVLGNRINYGK